MDAVFYVKKKSVHILKPVQYLVILGRMFSVKKKLKSFVIVKKSRKLFLVLMKVKLNFVVMKFVESN